MSTISTATADTAIALGVSNPTLPLSFPEEAALQKLWGLLLSVMSTNMPASPTLVKTSRDELNAIRGPQRNGGRRRSKPNQEALSPEEIRRGLYGSIRNLNPDRWCLQTLRANNYDAEASLDDMLTHMHWRLHKIRLDDVILGQGEPGMIRLAQDTTASKRDRVDAAGFTALVQTGETQALRGVDHENRAISLIRVRRHRFGFSTGTYKIFQAYHTELCRLLIRAGNVQNGLAIFDFEGYGVKNMEFKPVTLMINLFQKYYPQSLSEVILHRVPPIFMPAWKIIKLWLPEDYLSHIHVTHTVGDLEQYVPRANIPKELGGDDESSQWRYIPPDMNDPMNGGGGEKVQAARKREKERLPRLQSVVIDSFENATRQWIEASRHGDDIAEVRSLRQITMDELSAFYWKLDPYVRARSLYDQLGYLPQPPTSSQEERGKSQA